MKKIISLLCIATLIFTACKNNNPETKKEEQQQEVVKPSLLLSQVIITNLDDPDMAPDSLTLTYDNQNRLIGYINTTEQGMTEVDSIQYDTQGKITGLKEISDNGGPMGSQVIIRKIIYDTSGKTSVYETINYPDKQQNTGAADNNITNSKDTAIYIIKNGKMIQSPLFENGNIAYDAEGDYYDHKTQYKDSTYANPYALAGNHFLWNILNRDITWGNKKLVFDKEYKPYEISPYKASPNVNEKYPEIITANNYGSKVKIHFIYKPLH